MPVSASRGTEKIGITMLRIFQVDSVLKAPCRAILIQKILFQINVWSSQCSAGAEATKPNGRQQQLVTIKILQAVDNTIMLFGLNEY